MKATAKLQVIIFVGLALLLVAVATSMAVHPRRIPISGTHNDRLADIELQHILPSRGKHLKPNQPSSTSANVAITSSSSLKSSACASSHSSVNVLNAMIPMKGSKAPLITSTTKSTVLPANNSAALESHSDSITFQENELPPPISNKFGKWVDLNQTNAVVFPQCANHQCCLPFHYNEAKQKKFILRVPDSPGVGFIESEPRGALELLRILRNKRISFVGDSLSLQTFAAFSFLLDINNVTRETVKSALPGQNLGIHRIDLLSFYVPEFNVTVRATKTYRYFFNESEYESVPVRNRLEKKAYAFPDPMNTKLLMSREQMLWMINVSDIFVFNLGMFYLKADTAKLYKPTLQTLFSTFESIRAEIPNKLFVTRDVLPNHSINSSLSSHVCPNKPISHVYQNKILREVSEEYDIPLMQIEQFYVDRPELKRGLYPTAANRTLWDCLHFCHSPHTFSPFFNGLYEIIYEKINR
ncbi:hypothetical protein BC830DRAFT_1093497 [Chytriomyces sp. MP71]|nr:hypothetical protein BC830DRAFT_1093497 [Chytriomyces sp. MP71]